MQPDGFSAARCELAAHCAQNLLYFRVTEPAMAEPTPPGPDGTPTSFPWIRRFARFLVMHQAARRSTMFYLLSTALGFVLVGGILFPSWLRARPMTFIFFWLTCASLTLIALVLALFDLILVRVASRVAQRALRAQYRIEEDSR